MKILILQDFLRSGGTERQCVLLANAFAGTGHGATLVTFRPDGALAGTVGSSVRRVSLQPLADGRCAVVAESSPAFAAAHRHVYGSRSSAAQLLGAAPDPAEETATLEALQRALEQVVGLRCTGAGAERHAAGPSPLPGGVRLAGGAAAGGRRGPG